LNQNKIREAMAPLILSASGWRKVFAAGGNEESTTQEITAEDRLLTAAMARVFASLILKSIPADRKKTPQIALGIDSRPTGPAMAAAMIPVYLEAGIKVCYTGICAAPEIMAWTGTDKTLDGFCYISASHNPVGHNGVKFGLCGGVIGGKTAAGLIEEYRLLTADSQAMGELESLLGEKLSMETKKVLEEKKINKDASFKSYTAFTRLCASQTEERPEQETYFDMMREKISARPIGVVAEQNGSARSLSIDREYLENLGVKVLSLNDTPGQFVHRIVPEGMSLDLCRTELEKAHANDPAFVLGYVPDCDGDRGNIVYFNDKTDKAEILEAQEVFALSVLSELTGLIFKKIPMNQTAVAVNGPTSMRIDRIAALLGSEVYHAEVGEANVVNLAAQLRKEGKIVRILGEGSNGGNITHPAQVRDPLNTLTALMNLLLITTTDSAANTGGDNNADQRGLFHIWCEASGQRDRYKPDFTLSDIIASLPPFTTTSAFEERALARIKTVDHGDLKRFYEEIFPAHWEARKAELKDKWNVTDWEERNMEGIQEKVGVGRQYRSGQEKGGLKILFKNPTGENTDYIWMRGSGTEPVFRVLADCQGDNPEREAWFLAWHKEIIAQADRLACKQPGK
jgi:phosphoglucomutase